MSRHLIVDFEFCTVKKMQKTNEYRLGNEIIQIGAVLLSENNEEVSSFCTFVQPMYGRLDAFITKLTGIKEFDLKDAPSLSEAIESFAEWIPDDDVVAVSWSHTDDSQLRKEMEKKGIVNEKIARLLENWEDCQATFSEKIGDSKNYNLTEALNIADISYEDGAHDGMVDAHNTALLYIKMAAEEEMTLNKYYLSAINEEEDHHLHCDLSYLFEGLKLPKE